jgi:hypothetical protein
VLSTVTAGLPFSTSILHHDWLPTQAIPGDFERRSGIGKRCRLLPLLSLKFALTLCSIVLREFQEQCPFPTMPSTGPEAVLIPVQQVIHARRIMLPGQRAEAVGALIRSKASGRNTYLILFEGIWDSFFILPDLSLPAQRRTWLCFDQLLYRNL